MASQSFGPEPAGVRRRVTKLNSGHKLQAESNVSKKEVIAKPRAKRMQSLANVLEANEKSTKDEKKGPNSQKSKKNNEPEETINAKADKTGEADKK